MKKYLCVILLALVITNLPLASQTLSLCNIDPYIFETHYLLYFCRDGIIDVFVISKKEATVLDSELVDYTLLQEKNTYELTLHQLDSIPISLRPIHGFNVRERGIDMVSINADSSCGFLDRTILFYDYRQGKFMVPVYESPDIIGLHVKVDNFRKK